MRQAVRKPQVAGTRSSDYLEVSGRCAAGAMSRVLDSTMSIGYHRSGGRGRVGSNWPARLARLALVPLTAIG